MIQTLNTASPIIDTTAIINSPAKIILIAAFAIFVVGIVLAIIFGRKQKVDYSGFSVITGFLTAFCLFFVGMGHSLESYKESEKVSNTKISHYIQDKYGVTVLDEQEIGTDISDKTTLTRVSIPANTADSERIQITVELVDNETDVLAFSSGTEMKKIN